MTEEEFNELLTRLAVEFIIACRAYIEIIVLFRIRYFYLCSALIA